MFNDNSIQDPIDNSRQLFSKQELAIEDVDKLADELVTEYDNSDWRAWYCKVIYQFGLEQINEWRNRASTGRSPAKLFSLYVRQAKASTVNIPSTSSGKELDKVYTPSDEELTDEGIEKGLTDAIKALEEGHAKDSLPQTGENQ